MGKLRIRLTFVEPGTLHSRIEHPIDESGSGVMPYSEPEALTAIQKALDADDYRPTDFTPEERAWLQREELVVMGDDREFFSAVLRERIGRRLFGCLFPTERMRSIYDEARRDSERLRADIELVFDASAPPVVGMPWELVYDDTRENFVVGGGRGTLTRFLTFGEQPPRLSKVEELRLALVTPRPHGWDDLGTVEADQIGHLSSEASGRRISVVLQARRVDELERRLRERPGPATPNVIHFDGHGGFGRICPLCRRTTPPAKRICATAGCGQPLAESTPRGYLAFEGGEGGDAHYVSAREFADLIGGATAASNIRLVVISACRSADARGGGTVFNGLAQRLVEARVPAVVAIQLPIRAGPAAEFMSTFYGGLLRGATLAEAVGSAQTALGRDGDQWFRPVLYLRSLDNPDGRLLSELSPLTDDNPLQIDIPAREMPDEAACALRQVRRHLDDPHVIRSIDRSEKALATVFAQLEALGSYKTAHDELDKMQAIFQLIEEGTRRLRRDRQDWSDLSASLQALPAISRGLSKVAARGVVRERDAQFIRDLIEQCDRLCAAVESFDSDQAVAAVSAMRVALRILPSHFNDQLTDAAGDVRLPLLEGALADLEEALRQAEASSDEVQRVEAGTASVQREGTELITLIAEHDGWQQVDTVLTMLKAQGAADPGLIKPSWDLAKSKVARFFADRPEPWARALYCESDKIESGLLDLDLKKIKAGLGAFSVLARLRFTRLDQELLAKCERLEAIRDELRALLQTMAQLPTQGVLV